MIILRGFIEITCYEDLFQLSKKLESQNEILDFRRGANVVILNDLEGLVIKNKLLGVTYNNNSVESASGENWDDLVKDCLQKKLYGLKIYLEFLAALAVVQFKILGHMASKFQTSLIMLKQ